MTSTSVIGLVSFALLCFQCPEQLVECQDPPADGAKLGKVATNYLHGDYDEELNKLKGIQKIGRALGFGGQQNNKGNPDSRAYYTPENNPYFKEAADPSPDAESPGSEDPDSDSLGSGGPKGPNKGPGDPSPEDDDAAGGPDAGKGKGAEGPDGADDPKGASDPDADADDADGGANKDGDTSGKDQDLKGRGEGDEAEEGGGKSDNEDPDGKGGKGDEEGGGSGEEEGPPEEEEEDEKDPDVPLVLPPKIPYETARRECSVKKHKPKRVNVPLGLFLKNVQRYGYKAAKYPYASPWPNMYGKYGRTRSGKKRRGSRRRSRQRTRGYGYGYGYGKK